MAKASKRPIADDESLPMSPTSPDLVPITPSSATIAPNLIINILLSHGGSSAALVAGNTSIGEVPSSAEREKSAHFSPIIISVLVPNG